MEAGRFPRDEYKITVPEKKSAPEITKISDKLPDLKNTLNDCLEPESFVSKDGGENSGAVKHLYLTNPFLWNGVLDDDNYIEISRGQVKASSLLLL